MPLVETCFISLDFARFVSLSLSPDGKLLTTCTDTGIQRWCTETRMELRRNTSSGTVPLYTNADFTCNAIFSPDGTQIAGVAGSAVYLWDSKSGIQLSKPFDEHEHYVTALAFSPCGTVLCAGSFDSLFFWDLKTLTQACKPIRGW